MSNLINLLPVFLFLVGMLAISAYIQRSSKEERQKDFAKDYFIGGRTLGGFVLAMTTAATYSSVSTFVGGPGMAWIIGYGWLYMAIVQVVVIFFGIGRIRQKNCSYCPRNRRSNRYRRSACPLPVQLFG